MKILFCGDVVGKSGRAVVNRRVPELKEKYSIDFVVINGENAAHGFGLTPKLFQGFLNIGADVITLGNHSFDKADINDTLETDAPLVRPMNYPENTIGHGFYILEKDGVRICVAQLLGKVFMRPADDPFLTIRDFIQKHRSDYDVLIVDFHAEATAEKVGMGYFLDGQAALVIGTHTHIPTTDARILPQGTGYQTDVGMCGDYNSIIGMSLDSALPRFTGTVQRLEPASGEGTFCAILADIDPATNTCRAIKPLRLGGRLQSTDSDF